MSFITHSSEELREALDYSGYYPETIEYFSSLNAKLLYHILIELRSLNMKMEEVNGRKTT